MSNLNRSLYSNERFTDNRRTGQPSLNLSFILIIDKYNFKLSHPKSSYFKRWPSKDCVPLMFLPNCCRDLLPPQPQIPVIATGYARCHDAVDKPDHPQGFRAGGSVGLASTPHGNAAVTNELRRPTGTAEKQNPITPRRCD